MSAVKIFCPACAGALTLDEANAGTQVVCPDCRAVLTMPVIVDAALAPVVVSDGVPDAPLPPERIPLRKIDKTEYVKDRQAQPPAAASSGDTRPVPAPLPEPPAGPDGEARPKTRLPERRNMQASPVTGANAQAAGARGADTPDASAEETVRRPEAAPLRPIPARPDEIMQAAIPAARRVPAAPEPGEEAETPGEPGPRGGHRLGGDRQLHFTPLIADTEDAETAGEWGRDSHAGGKSRRMAVTAAVVVVLLGAGYGLYVWKYAAQAAAQAVADSRGPAPGKKDVPNPLENLEGARVVLRRFFAAATIEEMLKEVRHPEITEPRIRQQMAGKTLRPLAIVKENPTWNEIRIGDGEFITGMMELDDFRVVNVGLEIEKGGALKVDWESYANWAELPWKDFLKTLPDRQVDYRVTVTPIRYYNYSFKDREGEMISFRVEDPERFGYCYAYCHKDSDAAEKLVTHLKKARQFGRLNQDGIPTVNCILRLHYPEEGKKGNQALIDAYVNDSWILP